MIEIGLQPHSVSAADGRGSMQRFIATAQAIAAWLPGQWAGRRLGLDHADDARARERLPAHDEAFYWALVHSHL